MESHENHHRLYREYRDGERNFINFTIQSPDNSKIAVFSIEQEDKGEETHYEARFRDLRNHAFKEPKIVYYGQDKELAINAARGAARYFARTLDDKFEDCTDINHLLKEVRGDDLPFFPHIETKQEDE